jgi:hypothetical protein
MWELLLKPIFSIIDKVIPDPAAAAAAKLQAMQLQATKEGAELEANVRLSLAQTDVNKVEAASNSLFVAGWRPAVGWICAAALGFKYIGGPLLVMAAQTFNHPLTLPAIDSGELMPLLLGMLGLGGLRTIEKIRGAA